MDDLVRYIQTRDVAPFTPHDYNEVLRIVYTLLGVAARDGADTLTITPTAMMWVRQEQVLQSFPTNLVTPRVSYRDELHRILDRDTVVQRYVQFVNAGDGIETFLIGEAAPAPAAAAVPMR